MREIRKDEHGNIRITFRRLINSMIQGRLKEGDPQLFRHEFVEPTYIRTGRPDFPRIKVSAIEATMVVKSSGEPDIVIVEFKDLVGVILRDVLGGTTKSFDHDLKPLTS